MADSISSLGGDGLGQCWALNCAAMRQQREQRLFTAMDADGNGSISQGEFANWYQQALSGLSAPDATGVPSASDLFSQLDTNGDGTLSPDEVSGLHQKMRGVREALLFEQVDANGDGSVSQDEFTNWLQSLQPETAVASGQDAIDGAAATTSAGGVFSQLEQDLATTFSDLLGVLSLAQGGGAPTPGSEGALGAAAAAGPSSQHVSSLYAQMETALEQYATASVNARLNALV